MLYSIGPQSAPAFVVLTESVNAVNVEVATGVARTVVVKAAIGAFIKVVEMHGSTTVRINVSEKTGATDGKSTRDALILIP